MLAILTSTATACAEPNTVSAAGSNATVLKVVDGDTVDVLSDVRGRLRIRVIGLDTPETTKPGYAPACWGQQATEFATTTLLGQRVAVIPDPSQDVHDRYGRTLAYLETATGDYSVQAAAAGAGLAYVYGNRPPQRADAIRAAERAAREAGRGLWGAPCFGRVDPRPLG